MATSSNTEKKGRCVLLLTKAGGEMLRGLVRESVSASGLSLDGFLQAHYYRITHVPSGRERNISWAKDVLFPPDGSRTDIHKWELNVLCFIVLDICTLVGNLHPTIIDNVEDLKSMTNKLYHAAAMTDDEYEQCATQIENIVITSCKELNNAALLTRVEGIVDSNKSDPLSFGECAIILKTWYDMELETSERLIGLSNDNKEIIRKLDLLIKNACPNMKPSEMQLYQQQQSTSLEREQMVQEQEQKMHEWEQNMQELEQKMNELEQPLDLVNRPFRHQQLMEQLLMAKKQKLAMQQEWVEQQRARQQRPEQEWDEQMWAEQQAMQQKWAERRQARQQKWAEQLRARQQKWPEQQWSEQRKRLEQLQAEQQEMADMMKSDRFDMIKSNIKDKESLELDLAEDCPEESVTRQSPKSSDDDEAQSSKKLAKLANPAKLAAPKHDNT